MKKLTCASFFAGVGGIEKGFEKADFEILYANEFDANAIKTYEANYTIKVDPRDINEVDAKEIPKVDVYLAGFPCQAFSVAGYRQGFKDIKGRGVLFFELARLFRENKPEIIFLENVKNLIGHDYGKTFRIICETLEAEGYKVKYQVLNTMEYGNIPHNRERIYIVAFRNEQVYKEFDFPKPVELKKKLTHLIDFKNRVPDRFYYTSQSFSHYDVLEKAITRKDTVYQWRRIYVRENKSGVCPTLTANMGTGGHNVPLVLTDYGIRKLTPRECFNLQGFTEDFILPDNIALSQQYKQAGNSVSVTVVERIAENIRIAIEATEDDYSSNLFIKSS